MSDPPPRPSSRVSTGTLVAVVLLYVGDAFLMGQGVWATLPSLVAIVWLGARWLFGARDARPRIAATLAVWCALPVATIGTISANNVLAHHRAEALVVAVEAYKAKHGVFPRTLDDLVPEEIPAVPRAKYTLAFAQFGYFNVNGSASLDYTYLPPFGRPYYQFNAKRWGYLD
jgi:hypothetical protein